MKRIASFVFGLGLLAVTTMAFAAQFNGTIVSKDGKLWLSSGEKNYSITNPDKAKEFEGKSVKVSGSKDPGTGALTIDSVAAAQ